MSNTEYWNSLPQPLTQSQATTRANYWANCRTDEPHGFVIYFCEDEEAHYVVAYSQTGASNPFKELYEDLEIIDIVEPPDCNLTTEAARLACITLDC